MNALQIPVTIPQGISNSVIKNLTEQVTMYAQLLFSQASKTEKEMTKTHENPDIIDSLRGSAQDVTHEFGNMTDKQIKMKYLLDKYCQ